RAGVAPRGVPEQGVVGRDDEVGVAGLVEVPAVAVALRLDDADLLELLEAGAAALRVGEPLGDLRAVAEVAPRRVLHVLALQTEVAQQTVLGAVGLHELRQVDTAAEVVARAAD